MCSSCTFFACYKRKILAHSIQSNFCFSLGTELNVFSHSQRATNCWNGPVCSISLPRLSHWSLLPIYFMGYSCMLAKNSHYRNPMPSL
ncbi:hypothetical protein XENTR_v10016132 [Xenopus tropicalis]|nr:hypothetical protein XENTR_v10016132 [Xenopus tropicalis]